MYPVQSKEIRNLKDEIYALKNRIRYYTKMSNTLQKKINILQGIIETEEQKYVERFQKIEHYKEVSKK